MKRVGILILLVIIHYILALLPIIIPGDIKTSFYVMPVLYVNLIVQSICIISAFMSYSEAKDNSKKINPNTNN